MLNGNAPDVSRSRAQKVQSPVSHAHSEGYLSLWQRCAVSFDLSGGFLHSSKLCILTVLIYDMAKVK